MASLWWLWLSLAIVPHELGWLAGRERHAIWVYGALAVAPVAAVLAVSRAPWALRLAAIPLGAMAFVASAKLLDVSTDKPVC